MLVLPCAFEFNGPACFQFDEFVEVMASDRILNLPQVEVDEKDLDEHLDLRTYLDQKLDIHSELDTRCIKKGVKLNWVSHNERFQRSE